MDMTDDLDLDAVLDGLTNDSAEAEDTSANTTSRRPSIQMLRKIPVRLTLEVGSATLPLSELVTLEPGSVVELDRLAGEPLVIKVNGAPIGSAEVVVAGENYGLKIVHLDNLQVLTQ
ncbi:flagellar motor switch protein FliN [Paraburkholderia bonniea]|uniref:flagellar motor switch protein FliN n=1 Tax=Paraburkholderia bonniea TaxID=2152891 RepID=UPI001290EA8E|nr:flagellar motor switch protein FliN [Paraburkholderia bonniea]WJF90765.1 flagellar motor switch protein FliN [Paraburkholderia bonniea]WJF94079.1 flagellar motor switch protein FliN [Paraburkholderia bonniea]